MSFVLRRMHMKIALLQIFQAIALRRLIRFVFAIVFAIAELCLRHADAIRALEFIWLACAAAAKLGTFV